MFGKYCLETKYGAVMTVKPEPKKISIKCLATNLATYVTKDRILNYAKINPFCFRPTQTDAPILCMLTFQRQDFTFTCSAKGFSFYIIKKCPFS